MHTYLRKALHLVRRSLLLAGCCTALVHTTAMATDTPATTDPRIQHFWQRLQAGQSLKVTAIGGSVTTGYSGTDPEQTGWAAQVGRWLQAQAQQHGGQVVFTNLGVSGTDTGIAVNRVKAQAIDTQQDLVIVEFGVNDQWLDAKVRKRSYEGLLRQLLNASHHPAVVTLHLTQQGNQGRDAPDEQLRISRHYGLLSVDYGNLVAQGAAQGQVRWEDLYQEPVHPLQQGHDLIAQLVIQALQQARPAANAALTQRPVPAPLYDNEFEFTATYDNRTIKPYRNTGFQAGGDSHHEWERRPGALSPQGWYSTQDNAQMSFLAYGRQIGLYVAESDQYRNLQAWIDEQTPITVNTYNEMRQGYLGWAYVPVGRDLDEGPHLLHVRMKNDSFKGSGKQAGIVAILAAGTQAASSRLPASPAFNTLWDGADQYQWVAANDERIRYIGRFDKQISEAPLMAWSGNEIQLRFKSDSLALRMESVQGRGFFNVTVDGKTRLLEIPQGGPVDVRWNGPLDKGEHVLRIAKRSEAFFSQVRFHRIGLSRSGGQLLNPPPARPLGFAFYGDSITAGACNQDTGEDQYDDMSTHNGLRAYGAVTAQRLNADYLGIAVSGTGISRSWNEVLLPSVALRTAPTESAPMASAQDRQPDVVFVNLGQNDYGFPESRGESFPKEYQARYVAFVQSLRAQYPKARIVCLMGGMTGWRNSVELKKAFDAAVVELQNTDKALWSYTFKADSDQHPRIDIHERMATELTEFVRTQVLP